MNRILRSQLPPNPRDLAVFDTTTGSSPGRTRWMRMKKTCFALLALGLMLTSTSSFAQSFATIGGASTLTSTSTGNDPIDGYYASFRYQVVYTAAELTAAGMVPNASITGLGFSISADYAGGNLNGYTIGLGHTTATNAAAHNTAATTTVKNAFAYNPSVVALGSFDMITFDNSFVWDGSSNILINICTPGFNAYTSPYGQVRVISAASGSRYVRSDFADQCGVNTTNSNSNKPAISFAYSPPPACASLPNAPVASLTGATSICSGFTTAMTATGFSIASGVTTQWMVSNTPGGPYSNVSGGTGATTSSYTSAALTAGTYYFVCTSTCTATAETSTSNEIVLTVNALPTVTLTAPNGGAFCGVQTMTATGASSYVWSPSSALSATSGSSVDYIGTSDATITVTGTDANGCVGSIAQAITYVAPEAITLVSTVPNFCGTGGVSTITASSAGSYVYNFESLETAVLSNTTANTVDATVSQTSAIRVTGTDAASGCVAQSTLSIGLYPLPSATVTTTADGVCPGTQATINSGLSAGNFSSTAIPYAALTAPVNAVTLVTGGVATPSVTGSLDDGGWGNIPVGFTFDFFGVDYTTINIGTNGTLMFGPLNTNGGFGNPPGLADFTFTTLPSAAEPRNMVAVLAMDNNLNGATGGTIKYWTTGFAPNRKFVVSYENVKEFGDNQFSTAQAIFYETTGVVEVHVFSSTNVDRNKLVGINNSDGTIGSLAFASGTVANATNPIVNPIAYRFTPPSDYITIWEATPAGGTTIGLTNNVDGSTINTINGFSATVAPSVTTTYAISYTNATTFCSNALAPAQVVMEVLSNVSPAGVTATSTLTTVCPDANIPLATDYTGITDGLTYQWQVSTDGGANWTDITDATAATYTATQSVASSFRLGIASCGGTIEYTSPVAIALSPFQDCYCTPVSSGGTGTMINQVDVNTTFTNNSSATNPVASPYYTNYSTLPGTPAVAPGVVMNLALTLEPAGTYTNNIVSVWIDYNHSGTYEATEWTQFGTAVPSGATTTVGIAIPTTALPGNTGMRIRTRGAGNVNGATDACTFLGSGETEDYFINILGPCDPAVFTPPLASADDPDATVCGTQTSQLTAFDFNGSANPIYMWYDAATGGNLLQNSTSNFFTPAPITTTTTWYVATNTGTCITDRFPVTLNWVAPESITLTNSNPSSCGTTSTATDLAVTSANSGYAYTWTATPSAGSGITSGTTGASISGVTPTINGVYVYTASAVDAVSGCTTTATTTVGFYSPLTGTATVTQPLVCGGDGSVNFSVTGSGTVFASDFSSATLNPAQAELCNDAVIIGDKLQFTAPVNSQQGGILITNTTGVATNDFQIDFDMITTAGTTPPADGFSYSYGPDVVCMPTPVGAVVDNTVVGVGAANPENGSGSGIRLSFDAYTNGVNVNGIYLMYNCPRINPSSTLTPAEGLYYYDNNTSWIGGANTHVTITIDADGQLSMWLAGTQVLNNAQLPANYITADKSTWKHAFAARTGGLNQGHSIDNLDIHYNNFYEYSVDNGATWTTTSPVAVPAPSTVQNLARYVTTPSCSVDLGTATVEYQVAAPTNVTGGSACLNGNTLNVSANGAPINGVQTLTVPLGTNVNLPGAAVSYSLPYGQVTLNGNVSIPAGATITGANLVVNGLTANGFTWLSDLEVSLSGVSTIANQVFVAAPAGQTSPTNGGPYTIAASIPTGSGAVTCTFLNTYTGNVTMTSVNLVITYTLPSVPVWFDAATGGSVIGTGSTFNVIGTSYLPNASAPFTGNVYAASVVTNGASTCYSATVSAPVTVGQPLTVSIGASAPVTQTFSLATNYSVDAGATQTLTGSITIPAGAVVSSTVLRLNGVTTTGFTYGADVDVAMSGASNVANQSVANVFAEVTNGGPYTYTGSNIVAPGGDVFVTFTHNYSFGGPMDIASVEVLVTYEAPVTGSVCPGTPVTLTATTTGGGSNPTYQWNLNGTPIDGATSTSYVATPALASDAYTATVVDDCNPSGITSSGFSVNLFTATAGTITGPAAILVNDFTAPIPGAGTWNISGQNSGSTIQWSYGTVSTGPYITIAGGVDADQTLYASGAAGTIYLTATTTTTDGCSIQANVVEVVLGNAIDTPCTAAPLTFGNQDGVEWSSAAASAQTGETYGDGNPDPGNTIWFSFVAPASGHVSIESTSSIFWDNYMTLFSGSDCTDPAGMTQLGFNDDANGTAQAALMDVTCLIPGTTYYVQMRGFANFIGQAGITLTDLGNIAPAITGLSSNITASAATATCAATVTWAEPIASDDQGQGCVTLTSDIASGASFNVGTTTVTYTATDAQGLVTTASFTVTVNDTQLPTITAPADVQVTSALNTCTATATLGSATTADNCGVATTTNNAPATFPVGTTTVVWTVTDVNGNVATANQIVTVVPDPTNLWYVDADGDNYGVAGASVVACSQPAGYAANTTDCNDANVNVNPGAIEICGNAIDDNCSGTPEEGCTNPGENPSNATSMSTSIWPNCNAVNGTLVNATVSGAAQTVCLTGEDKWHQFVATSEGVSIVVNSSAADIVIELQTAAGVLVAQENAVAGLGGEILNHYGLTAGQVYKVGVRNFNSALGTGTYSICAKMLKRGGCDYGPGPYSLCQYFKATWAGATGTSYTFTYTGITGPAAGNVYTRTQNSDICILSSVLPRLPYGSTYSVLITNTYTINNGAGVAETISVPGLAPCSMSTVSQPVTALRTSDRCTAGPRFRGSVVASLPWVCGITNWRWEFTELDAQGNPVGLPIIKMRGAASNYLNLGTVLQLQYGKTYSVRTAPILSYTGTDYQWGTPFCMSIVGSAGMIADGSQANNQTVRVETADEVNMSLYPNPTHGTDVNINLSGVDSENVQIRIVDAMGRQVWNNRYSVSGVLNTNITFERPLANGLYMVEAIFNGEVHTQRMMVQK